MTHSDLIAILAMVVSTSTVLIALLITFQLYHRRPYNEPEHRAQLEMLRASMEKQIYRLNDQLTATQERWSDTNHFLASRLEAQPKKAESRNVTALTPFLQEHGITTNDLRVDPKLVLMLTPFHQKFEPVFEAVADACRKAGLICLRGDETRTRGDLLPHILRLILKARIIVANIDGRNPNVFYELGIAHSMDKVTIMITNAVNSAPFDLRSKKLLVYSRLDELEQALQTELTRALV